jgi:hypothetical protein
MVGRSMTEDFKGKCRFCFWNKNLPRCHPARMISNPGNCRDWRMYKLSDEDKKAQKAKQNDAYLRDKEKRKEQRKLRKKESRGGA